MSMRTFVPALLSVGSFYQF